MKTIVLNPTNPLSVKHFSSKLEFAGRGAGHNHGVLWLDIQKIEKKVDIRQLEHLKEHSFHLSKTLDTCLLALSQHNNKDHHLKNPSEVQSSLDHFLTIRGIEIDHSKTRKRHRTFTKNEYDGRTY